MFLLYAVGLWPFVLAAASASGGVCLLQGRQNLNKLDIEKASGVLEERDEDIKSVPENIGCFRLGIMYCGGKYRAPFGKFGAASSRSVKACAAECEKNSRCQNFVIGSGTSPCRLSFVCTQSTANRKSAAWKSYFRQKSCVSAPTTMPITSSTTGTTAALVTSSAPPAPTPLPTPLPVPSPTPAPTLLPTQASNGNGTFVMPGDDLKAALQGLQPGGTLIVRGRHLIGKYNSGLRFGKKCTQAKPCRIIGEGATLDGSVELTPTWVLMDELKNQWKTQVPMTIWQLWMDGKPLTVARSPNVDAWSENYWDKKKSFLWARGSGASNWLKGSMPRPGAAAFPDAAEQNLEGCIMVINSGSWLSFARRITKHEGRRIEFSGLPKKLPKPFGPRGVNTVGLFFECGTLLDAPNEWWFDKDPNGNHGIVTLQLPSGMTPHGKTFRGRTISTVLDLDRAQHVQVHNLNFFSGGIRFAGTKHVTIKGCSFLYPYHSKRVLKRSSPGGMMDASGASDFYFQNNVVRYTDGALMTMRNAARARIENNEFFMIDHAVVGGMGGTSLDALNNRDFVYRFNTLAYAGSSDNIRYSVPGTTPEVGAETYMNYHTHCGASQTDGATVQIAAGTGPWNNYVHHNWFVNTGRGGMRFDGWQAGVCGVVYRNVAYNTGAWGFRLKGDFHKIIANTDLSTSLRTTGPAAAMGPARAGGKSNGNSISQNNAARYDTYNGAWVGTTSHNWAGKEVKDFLVDPEGFDFRPKPGDNPLVDGGEVIKELPLCGSNGAWGHFYDGAKQLPVDWAYVGAAPDIGAYEQGADSYWIPGRREGVPSHPIPQHTGSVRTDLMWRPACGQFPECLDDELAGIAAYHVLAGCVEPQDPSQPIMFQKIAVTRANLLVSPWMFAFNTPCSWRVDTEMKDGTVRTGKIWSYHATWQNCTTEWVQCNGTITWKNNNEVNTAFSTGLTPWGTPAPTKYTLRVHSTFYMQCVIPDAYAQKQGPLGGKWLDAVVNVPKGAWLYPVSGAPAWEAANTTGTSPWVLEAEANISQAGGAAPEGLPIPKKGSEASVSTDTFYCEDYQEYLEKMNLGRQGLPGGIFRARKRCENDLVTSPGTYTFAMKARKAAIHTEGPMKPSIGLSVCVP